MKIFWRWFDRFSNNYHYCYFWKTYSVICQNSADFFIFWKKVYILSSCLKITVIYGKPFSSKLCLNHFSKNLHTENYNKAHWDLKTSKRTLRIENYTLRIENYTLRIKNYTLRFHKDALRLQKWKTHTENWKLHTENWKLHTEISKRHTENK